MNNPEFESDILKSIDKNGYSEKQIDLQMDKKGTVRQQIKQMNTPGHNPSPKKSGVLLKKDKKTEIIFER